LEIPFFQAGLFFFLVLQNFILVSAAGDGDGGKKKLFLACDGSQGLAKLS